MMWTMLARCSCLVLAVLVTSLAAGCTFPATQLLVVVDSDYGDGELSVITVRTYEASEYLASSAAVPVGQQPLSVLRGSMAGVEIPFSFGVVPLDRDVSRRVVVELTATSTSGAEIVVRAITGFVERETRRLPIFISRSCEGVVCGRDLTCDVSGQCVPASVDPGPPVVPGQEFDDSGAGDDGGIDAGSTDASMDAPPSIDAHIPPGIDGDLDAPAPPDAGADAYTEPPDAWAPDAFVPPGVDADLDAPLPPDAWAPDAFTPLDAHLEPDAFTPLDAHAAPDAPDAFTPLDAFESPDAFVPADATPDAFESIDSGGASPELCTPPCPGEECMCVGVCIQQCTSFRCVGDACVANTPRVSMTPLCC